MGEDRSFFFRGPEAALKIQAQNLSMFLQVDDLADEVAAVAAVDGLALSETRALVRSAVETRYTAPATTR